MMALVVVVVTGTAVVAGIVVVSAAGESTRSMRVGTPRWYGIRLYSPVYFGSWP
jgi:hypothetical protein